jgi:hypothetical protein
MHLKLSDQAINFNQNLSHGDRKNINKLEFSYWAVLNKDAARKFSLDVYIKIEATSKPLFNIPKPLQSSCRNRSELKLSISTESHKSVLSPQQWLRVLDPMSGRSEVPSRNAT